MMDMVSADFFPLVIAVSIGSVLILIVALRLLLSDDDRHERDVRRRLGALRPAVKASGDAAQIIQRATGSDRLMQFDVMARFAVMLRQADVQISAAKVALFCLAATVALAVPCVTILGVLPGIVATATLGIGLPYAVIASRRTKRIAAFTAQLPDALDLMVRGLRVGHPLGATIANVAQAMPDPLGTEFRRLADQIAYGDDLATAFRSLADRVDQEDMHYLAVSVGIQHSTGGNLAQMLSVLAGVIRDRIMMRRRVRAISSEGRISATLLSALPVVIYAATSITAPDYYGGVKDEPAFMPIACVIVALVVGNFLALRKLTSFRF